MSFTLTSTDRTRTDKIFWTVEEQAMLHYILHWIWFEYHISSSTTFLSTCRYHQQQKVQAVNFADPSTFWWNQEHTELYRHSFYIGVEIKLHMWSAAFQKSEIVIFADNYNLKIKRKEPPFESLFCPSLLVNKSLLPIFKFVIGDFD